MARGFDRRALLQGGCAMWAVGCGGVRTVSTDDDPPVGDDDDDSTTTDSGDPTDPGFDFDGYPCNQAIDPSAEGWTELALSVYPDLAEVGGWYGVQVEGVELVVAHVVEGCYAAIHRACAHEGTAIDYRPERLQFVCPKHGAVYNPDGTKVAGPQRSGLPSHPCGRVGDSIFVRL